MSEWISVKDKLPDVIYTCKELTERAHVLVTNGRSVFIAEHSVWHDGRLESGWRSDEGIVKGITHWMPLPEPPKEQA